LNKIWWLAITLLLVGCVPVQPQQDQLVGDSELNQPVVVEQRSQVLTAPGLPNPSDVEVVGGDEASLRAFIARWFSSPYPGAPDQETVVHIGELPPDMAIVLPFPPGARVVGSIEGYYQQLQIYFDSELEPEKVFAYYDEALGPDWHPVNQEHHRGAGNCAENASESD